MACLHSLEELDGLALRQAHERLLPLGTPADEAARAARFARHPHRAHLEDLHREQLLHRALDLVLVGARVHGEGDDVALLARDRALLRDERPAQHLVGRHDDDSLRSSPSRWWMRASASWVTTSRWWRSTSYTLSPSARSTSTPGRFRAASSSARSGPATTSSTEASPRPRPRSASTSSRVRGASSASCSTTVSALSRRRSESALRSAARRTFLGS